MLFVDTVMHAVILDFMAFTGQHLGHYHDQSTLRKEDFLRRFLLNEIEAQTEPTFCSNGIKETFLLIAWLIKPIKDPIKRALSSMQTKKVDDYLSVQERPIDGTSLHPRN